MAIDTLEKVPLLYHFTDRRNLPVIKEMGGLNPLAQLDQKKVKVPAPGGNEWSRDADALKGMGNYVHLCFRSTHPMEFVARQDGRITDTIFLQIHPSVMQFEGALVRGSDIKDLAVCGCRLPTTDFARCLSSTMRPAVTGSRRGNTG